jgi:hypothetical protein
MVRVGSTLLCIRFELRLFAGSEIFLAKCQMHNVLFQIASVNGARRGSVPQPIVPTPFSAPAITFW